MNIGMNHTGSPLSSPSPEKRRRKVPDKFREHMTPMELAPHKDPTLQQEVSSYALAEPEASAEKVAANEKNAVQAVKKRRGRPPKVRPNESSLDSERKSGFQVPAPVNSKICMFRYEDLNFRSNSRTTVTGLFDVKVLGHFIFVKLGGNLFLTDNWGTK
jgi:hypothetical protein